MRRPVAVAAVSLLALVLGCSKGKDDKAGAEKQPPISPVNAEVIATDGSRQIDIKVTKSGYTPDKVELKAGEQVTLVFTRVEDTQCGAEVQIPSIGVKKELPLNQPVAIAYKADKPGEVGFACGMDMMKGTLVVQ